MKPGTNSKECYYFGFRTGVEHGRDVKCAALLNRRQYINHFFEPREETIADRITSTFRNVNHDVQSHSHDDESGTDSDWALRFMEDARVNRTSRFRYEHNQPGRN